jgi:hypothetical protein
MATYRVGCLNWRKKEKVRKEKVKMIKRKNLHHHKVKRRAEERKKQEEKRWIFNLSWKKVGNTNCQISLS